MGRVIGFELNSQEPEKAAEFYAKVFGWEVAPPNWEYRAVTTGDDKNSGINGGIAKGHTIILLEHVFKLKWILSMRLLLKLNIMVPSLFVTKWSLMSFILPIW